MIEERIDMSEHTDADARFLGPGEGQAIWFLRNRMTVKATGAGTGAGSASWNR
jgi:hypothetical protein